MYVVTQLIPYHNLFIPGIINVNAIIYGYRFISVGEVIQEGLRSDATKPTTETDEINGIEIPTSINGI